MTNEEIRNEVKALCKKGPRYAITLNEILGTKNVINAICEGGALENGFTLKSVSRDSVKIHGETHYDVNDWLVSLV